MRITEQEMLNRTGQENVKGYFNQYDNNTYIVDTLINNPDNPVNQCELSGVLIHEDEHRKQYEAGDHRTVKCKERLESKAYYVEANWLYDNDCISSDRLALLRRIGEKLSSCP